jgi:diguanylate cyclase (GGDEF)-like protein
MNEVQANPMTSGHLRKGLPAGTYIVLVRSLYLTPLAHILMSLAFLAVGSFVLARTPDRLLLFLVGVGIVARVAQVAMVLLDRKRALSEDLDAAGARILERRFAWAYLSSAIIFGAFVARVFQVSTTDLQLLVVGLLFGYGAGLVAGLSLRPWISIPALLLAVLPTVFIAWLTTNVTFVAFGALLILFVGAGVQSIVRLYRSTAIDITMRRTFATLARRDDLTGLPNRLALRESFERFSAEARVGDIVAVHCLDLDRFKPVNDIFGHPAGDALLLAVSARLNGLLRRGDIAARLGGDEFVIIQTGAKHPDEADLLARRIIRSVAEPFSILGHQIEIGISVGYALFPEHGRDLDDLLGCADEALIAIKRNGGGIAMHREFLPQRGHRQLGRQFTNHAFTSAPTLSAGDVDPFSNGYLRSQTMLPRG